MENNDGQSDAHLLLEPSMTTLLLSGDGMVLWFGLIVALFPSFSTEREDSYIIWFQLKDSRVCHKVSHKVGVFIYLSFWFYLYSLVRWLQDLFSQELCRLTKQAELGFPAFLVTILLGFLAPVVSGNTSCSHGPLLFLSVVTKCDSFEDPHQPVGRVFLHETWSHLWTEPPVMISLVLLTEYWWSNEFQGSLFMKNS